MRFHPDILDLVTYTITTTPCMGFYMFVPCMEGVPQGKICMSSIDPPISYEVIYGCVGAYGVM